MRRASPRSMYGTFGRVGAERLGAADDLHDLGGDRVLAGPVHDAAEVLDELLGVVGGAFIARWRKACSEAAALSSAA